LPKSAGGGRSDHRQRLKEEPDVTIRQALLLSLGENGETELSSDARKEFLPTLQEIYRHDTDPGLHTAAEWLLWKWKEEAWLRQINDEWSMDKEQREKRLEGVKYYWRVGRRQPPEFRRSGM